MKELSIEQKAKRYDEAIEKLRNAFYDNNSRMCEEYRQAVISIIEPIFPELKESEDERIRKELLDFCKNRAENYPNDPKYKNISSWIAWLEKQGNLMKALQISNAKIGELIEKNYYLKEQLEKQSEHAKFFDSIQVGDKVTRNQDGVLVNLSQLKRVAKPAEVQGEQKPVEPQQDMLSQEKYAKAVDECIYGGKKPDCNEEDETMITLLHNIVDHHYSLDIIKKEEQLKLEGWLKSLKLQLCWKPTDDQMKALWDSIPVKVKEISEREMLLDSLYQDLKKLREE